MTLFNIVFQSVLALLGIGILGFWIMKRGIIPESVISILSRLAIDIALPSVIFANIVKNFDYQLIADWWILPITWLIFSIILLILTIAASQLSSKLFRSEFTLSLYFQNGLFFPFIILTGLFGPNSPFVVQLFIFIMIHPVVFFSSYHLFFRNKINETEKPYINIQRIVNPVLIATIMAMVVVFTGINDYFPQFLLNMFDMLGDMALPLVMIILGGSLFIGFKRKGEVYTWEVLKFVFMKNILFPLVFIFLLAVVQPAYHLAIIIFLQSAAPPITGIPIQVERVGGNTLLANQFILGSFAFSIISIPLLFLLFNYYFPMPI